MPFPDEQTVDLIERNAEDLVNISRYFERGMTNEQIAAVALKGIEYDLFDELDVEYHCDCTRARMERSLISLGEAECMSLADEDPEGKVELTGSLGDVMKESARIAVSYIRAHAAELGIAPDFYKNYDLHIHFPEGATPKDGPSAGAAMVTALASALSGATVRRDLAMTGEVTLTGEVLAIGGLKEKTMAAAAAGVKTVLIPADNVRDLPELDKEALAVLQIIPCRDLGEVLSHALTNGIPQSTPMPIKAAKLTMPAAGAQGGQA
jgi:predicted ATP-dependent protease